MTDVRVGQRVRVVLEGEVTAVLNGGEIVIGGDGDHANYIHPDAKHVASVEVLRDPEPADVPAVIDAEQQAWLRQPGVPLGGRAWMRLGPDGLTWHRWDELDDPRPAVRAEP